ncbi:MAG: hypothetical protein KKA65_05740, partial [Nanoarchaeota archaeon]|nr:hypothetical protein [Nanoarchaeota archaeon]
MERKTYTIDLKTGLLCAMLIDGSAMDLHCHSKYSSQNVQTGASSTIGVQESNTSIKKLYADESYHKVNVKYELIPDPKVPEKVTAKFIIDQGPKSNIIRVNFVGNTKIADRKLRKMVTTKEEWLLGFIEDAGKFKQDDLEMDKHRIEFLYRDKGYLTTTVQKTDIKYSK